MSAGHHIARRVDIVSNSVSNILLHVGKGHAVLIGPILTHLTVHIWIHWHPRIHAHICIHIRVHII